ncbi:Sugar fermentation stimulation protein homolog [uncultured Desulfobacterium sp.]|uniref:Sugar fermentation stimulation protein homolog n=1 Tax=uncultured Desulfobacterium sp. TaxID=201089 RepID=A0A445MVD8_9BACT|nr:Sugar fermentation stimulation protein homolog [uncultured Desulfobacterium sp.]
MDREKTTNQNNHEGLLEWPRLIGGTLIKRYKRFLADVRLKNGHVVTAHCANSGSMLECSAPGRPVYLTRHDSPNRRLRYTWEMIEMPSSLVGVNTMVPNRLVRVSIESGKIRELTGFDSIRSEVRYGENSRVDLLLEQGNHRCFVEIKNCTLVSDGVAYFPDAITSRGLKHLVELQNQIRSGNRCVMFYLIQRMDAKLFRPADHIDPAYGMELRRAVNNGVEILAYDVQMDLNGIKLNKTIPIKIT